MFFHGSYLVFHDLFRIFVYAIYGSVDSRTDDEI